MDNPFLTHKKSLEKPQKKRIRIKEPDEPIQGTLFPHKIDGDEKFLAQGAALKAPTCTSSPESNSLKPFLTTNTHPSALEASAAHFSDSAASSSGIDLSAAPGLNNSTSTQKPSAPPSFPAGFYTIPDTQNFLLRGAQGLLATFSPLELLGCHIILPHAQALQAFSWQLLGLFHQETLGAAQKNSEGFCPHKTGRLLPHLSIATNLEPVLGSLAPHILGNLKKERTLLPPLKRQLLLMDWLSRTDRVPDYALRSPARLADLARHLDALLENAFSKEIPLDTFGHDLPDQLSDHTQKHVNLLRHVFLAWPQHLQEKQIWTPALYQRKLADTLTAYLAAHPARFPVLMADVSAQTTPALKRFMHALAKMPKGCVVLSDTNANADFFSEKAGGQKNNAALDFEKKDFPAAQLWPWTALEKTARHHRCDWLRPLFSEDLTLKNDDAIKKTPSRAETADSRRKEATHLLAVQGLSALEAHTLDDEARGIALFIRGFLSQSPENNSSDPAAQCGDKNPPTKKTLSASRPFSSQIHETDQTTQAAWKPFKPFSVVVATHDSVLAQKIKMALASWKIPVECAHATPLSQTLVGRFLNALLAAVTQLSECNAAQEEPPPFDLEKTGPPQKKNAAPKNTNDLSLDNASPVSMRSFIPNGALWSAFLGLLRHPWTARRVAGVPLSFSRKSAWIHGLEKTLRRPTPFVLRISSEAFRLQPVTRPSVPASSELILRWVSRALAPLLDFKTPRSWTEWLDSLSATCQRLCGFNLLGADGAPFLSQEERAPQKQILDALFYLRTNRGPTPKMTFKKMSEFLISAVLQGSSAPKNAAETVSIMAPHQAAMLSPTCVILAGMNAGSWPHDPQDAPLFNLGLQKRLELFDRQEWHKKQAEHFKALLSAPRVLLSRHIKKDTAVQSPSFFWDCVHRHAAPHSLKHHAALLNVLNQSIPERKNASKHHLQPSDLFAQINPAQKNLTVADSCNLTSSATFNSTCPAPGHPVFFRPNSVPAPQALPPLYARPKNFSVTAVQRLLNDPYAFYARHILNLLPDVSLGGSIDASAFGLGVHAWLESCVTLGQETRGTSKTSLNDLADLLLSQRHTAEGTTQGKITQSQPEIDWFSSAGQKSSISRPQWKNIVQIAQDRTLAALPLTPVQHFFFHQTLRPLMASVQEMLWPVMTPGTETYSEASARHTFATPAGKLTLYARADRIDVRAAHPKNLHLNTSGMPEFSEKRSGKNCSSRPIPIFYSATIIDYKTGLVPPLQTVLQGSAPQLPLEGALWLAGGFFRERFQNLPHCKHLRALSSFDKSLPLGNTKAAAHTDAFSSEKTLKKNNAAWGITDDNAHPALLPGGAHTFPGLSLKELSFWRLHRQGISVFSIPEAEKVAQSVLKNTLSFLTFFHQENAPYSASVQKTARQNPDYQHLLRAELWRR